MFSGSFVALVTPFANGKIDFSSLEKLIEFHIKSKTDGIVVCGSTGEGLLLSDEEKNNIADFSVKIAKNRLKIIMGCSYASTNEAIYAVKKAQDCGVDGALVIVPFYVKPTQNGIIQHFIKIHNSTDLPIILYNNPGRCAVDMSVDTIATIFDDCERVVSLKDSNTDISRVYKIKEKCQKLNLLSGDDGTLFEYIKCGGNGAISVMANLAPSDVKNMINAVKNENLDKAKTLNDKLMKLNNALCLDSNPISIKYAMAKNNYIKNELRLPLTQACNSVDSIDCILESIDFA